MVPYGGGTATTITVTSTSTSDCTAACSCCGGTGVIVIASSFYVDNGNFPKPEVSLELFKRRDRPYNSDRFYAATSHRMRREVKPVSKTDRHQHPHPPWREYCRRK
jgi:hypothetical protein